MLTTLKLWKTLSGIFLVFNIRFILLESIFNKTSLARTLMNTDGPSTMNNKNSFLRH